MKIMHLISGGDVGGAKTQVLTTLQELNKKQNVTLVCFIDGPFADDARKMGIPTKILKSRNPFVLQKHILRELIHGKYEILHCHGAKANLYGSWVRGRLSIPVVSTVHSDPKLDYLGRPFANLSFGVLNRVLLRYRDGWVSVSDAMKDLLISRNYDADKIFPIYNGISFPEKLAYRPRKEFLSGLEIDWEESCVICGIAARLNPVKDLKTLIRAFGAAAHQCDSLRLLIAGDGEQRAELETMAQQLCPCNTVRFVGWQNDMNSFYHCLDINLLSSISETFPYAITEGARMNCATIATAVGGVPKVVIDGETGFLIDVGDWKRMSESMVKLARDTKLRSDMGQRIYRKVRTEFSSEVMAERQMEIYGIVISRYEQSRRARYGAVICGAYGKDNVGDDSILKTIIAQLREQDPCLPICVMTRKRKNTAVMTGVSTVFIFNWLAAARWMKKSQIYISGGGTLIQNVTSTRSLLYYLMSIRQAKKLGCKVIMYGCGVGPVHGNRWQRKTADILNRCVDQIMLRDPESAETLKDYGVTKPPVSITADPALLMHADVERAGRYLKDNGVPIDTPYMLLVMRPWEDINKRISAIAEAAEYCWERYRMMPLFMCFEPSRDEEITRLAAALLHVPYKILSANKDGETICGVIAHAELVVAMRLHALIFACSQNTRIVGISYDPKISGFMHYVGSEEFVEVNHLSGTVLCEKIDHAMQQQVLPNLAQMKQHARDNGVITGNILKAI